MNEDLHTYRALSPGSLNGDKPKSYGTGRRCVCGTKIMQYRKGDRCGLCENDDERHAKFVALAEEANMLGANLWKSKDHPEGCRECPEGEKFKRRHAGNGLCSLHRSRAKRNGTLDSKANEVADAARAITLEATAVDNGTKLDRHLATVPDPLDYPADDEGAAAYRDAVLAQDAPEIPAHHCAGDDCDPTCDGQAERHEHTDECVDGAGGDAELVCGAPTYTPNPDGCPKDAGETCCFNPDECNPGWQGEGRPEPPDDEPEVAQACCGSYPSCDRPCVWRGKWLRDQELATSPCGAGCCAPAEPMIARFATPVFDREVVSMALVLEALDELDRDARIRVLKWAAARLGVDRPASEAPATMPES